MKNMDVDSGEKNRLKEEVRKIRFLIEFVYRMLSWRVCKERDDFY